MKLTTPAIRGEVLAGDRLPFREASHRMPDLNVRIERLPPMRVACVRAFGATPEHEAWSKLRSWAEAKGWLAAPASHPVFGFNSPPAAAGSLEYGYEMWIAGDTESDGIVEVQSFPGGLYAVTSCGVVGGSGVPATWRALLRWVHLSPHAWRRSAHELERIQNPLVPPNELVLDLLLPIEG